MLFGKLFHSTAVPASIRRRPYYIVLRRYNYGVNLSNINYLMLFYIILEIVCAFSKQFLMKQTYQTLLK